MIILLLAFLFLRGILVLFFIAFILNTGLRPIVDRLENEGIPRVMSITLIYLSFLFALILFAFLLANQLIMQVENLITAIPQITENVIDFIDTSIPAISRLVPLDNLKKEVVILASDAQQSSVLAELFERENVFIIFSQAYGIFGGVADILVRIFAIVVISGYMLQRKDNFYEGFIEYIPTTRKAALRRTLDRIEDNLGSWLLGQFSLMMIIGICTYFILMLPGLFFSNEAYQLDGFALPLAMLAAIMAAIPNIGALFTFVFAVILAAGTSGIGTVLYVVITFLALQQVESNLIGPQVMKRAVGIDPIISILAIIAAFQFYGVIGAALIIPILAIIKIIISEVLREYYPRLIKE
jgi:predicted PurR-regulated permease PerM